MKVSVVMPVYNEKEFILPALDRLAAINFPGLDKEVIVVDDGSTDGTKELLLKRQTEKVFFHQKNLGKGAALMTGFAQCSGDIIAIQDADLEYDPNDLVKLVELVASGQAPVAYGSRMMGKNPVGHYAYYLGNKLISLVTRILYGAALTDVETGYKVFRKDVLDSVALSEPRFGFEIQFTVNVLKSHLVIKELPIKYAPRQFSQGKKIGWRDGVEALWLLIKYRFGSK